MTVMLPIGGKKFATLISAYAPTMTNPDEVQDKLYKDLHSVVAAVPNIDKLIVLEDFTARVGTDSYAWEGIISKHGIGKCNNNGHLLLRFCAPNNLLITNTVFCLPNQNKTTWMYLRSKQ